MNKEKGSPTTTTTMAKRCIFNMPWTPTYRAAFKDLAIQLYGPKGKSAELARMVLEEFMFCCLKHEKVEKHNLLGKFGKWQKTVPDPKLLVFALEECSDRKKKPHDSKK